MYRNNFYCEEKILSCDKHNPCKKKGAVDEPIENRARNFKNDFSPDEASDERYGKNGKPPIIIKRHHPVSVINADARQVNQEGDCKRRGKKIFFFQVECGKHGRTNLEKIYNTVHAPTSF